MWWRKSSQRWWQTLKEYSELKCLETIGMSMCVEVGADFTIDGSSREVMRWRQKFVKTKAECQTDML